MHFGRNHAKVPEGVEQLKQLESIPQQTVNGSIVNLTTKGCVKNNYANRSTPTLLIKTKIGTSLVL